MINKETYIKGLKLICLDAGLEFSGEKGDKLLMGKITLFEHFLQDFENKDFESATLQIIRKETFYNKIPQVKVFIDYCEDAKTKRQIEERVNQNQLTTDKRQNLIKEIYIHFNIKKGDYLFSALAAELRSIPIEVINRVFNILKRKKSITIDDWRKTFDEFKNGVINQRVKLILPNLKLNK